jgi:CheY-like chemotaxis protein
MVIAFLTRDLVFPSRVAGAAAKIGARLETAASIEALVAKMRQDAAESAIAIIDLGVVGVDVANAVQQLRALSRPPRMIVAFGPHVHEQKLEGAENAGCDLVLSRGKFASQIDALVARWAAQSSAAGDTD